MIFHFTKKFYPLYMANPVEPLSVNCGHYMELFLIRNSVRLHKHFLNHHSLKQTEWTLSCLPDISTAFVSLKIEKLLRATLRRSFWCDPDHILQNAQIQPLRLLDWWENRAVASPRTIIGNFTPLASTFASAERVERFKAHGEQLRCQNCHKEPFCCQDDREERRDEERENDRDRKKEVGYLLRQM